MHSVTGDQVLLALNAILNLVTIILARTIVSRVLSTLDTVIQLRNELQMDERNPRP